MKAHISIALNFADSALGIKIVADADGISVNGVSAEGRKNGWTLSDIIEFAAYEVPAPDKPYGLWHDHIFVESFEQIAPRVFEVRFGS
jgi:hypothetical protein